MKLAHRVGLQIPEIRDRPDVDAPLIVLIDRTHGLPVRDINQPPRRAIVLKDAARRAYVQHVAFVEQKRPILCADAVFAGVVHADERPALLRMAAERRGCLRNGGACQEQQTQHTR